MNIPTVKLGLVAVSRNCFPMALSERRRDAIAKAYAKEGDTLFVAKTIIETEADMLAAHRELLDAGVNALVLFLGNFGPEIPETMLVQRFDGPAMVVAASEDSGEDLYDGRGDAYCGMLNCSYNLGLRGLTVHIPEYPVGTPEQIAGMMAEFVPVARVVLGVKNLKIFTFGPRPYDFFACNAPVKPLFDLGVEVQENSELDLFEVFKAHERDARIPDVVADMQRELGAGNKHPGILKKLAMLELSLLDWKDKNLGASKYAAFANKCWPAFQTQFGCVPCYVNSRLTSRLMPVACEVDIYGALTEYILACATGTAPTLLDINNTVPLDTYEREIKGEFPYRQTDTFMAFHCGNTSSCLLKSPQMGYQLIMRRNLEPDREPDISRGTLEGDLKEGSATLFRLQGSADTRLTSYIAQGEVLPVPSRSFGSIGVVAFPEMARFYRHVLIEKRYPHHGGFTFTHAGKTLFAAMKMLGVGDIAFNQPAGMRYKSENPFA